LFDEFFEFEAQPTGKGWVLELATRGGGAYKGFDEGDGNTVSASTEVLKGSGARREFWVYS
jgi:hypothetical protein